MGQRAGGSSLEYPQKLLMDPDWVSVCFGLVSSRRGKKKTVDDLVLEQKYDKSATKSINR